MSHTTLRIWQRNALSLASWLLAAITVVISSLVSAPVSAQSIVDQPTYLCPQGETSCTIQPQWSATGYSVSATTDQSIRLELPSNPEAQATGSGLVRAWGMGVDTGGAFAGADGAYTLTPSLYGQLRMSDNWSFQLEGGFGFSRAFEQNWVAPTSFIGAVRSWDKADFAIGPRITYIRSGEADTLTVAGIEPRVRFHLSDSIGVQFAFLAGAGIVNVEQTEVIEGGAAQDVYGASLEEYAQDDQTVTTTISETRFLAGGSIGFFVQF